MALYLSLSFGTLMFMNVYFLECLSFWVFVMLFYNYIQSLNFGQECQRSGKCFSVHYIGIHVRSGSSIIWNVNFDHLVKVASVSFLYCKINLISFIVSKWSVRRSFESMWISWSSNSHLLVLAPMDNSRLAHLLCWLQDG